MIDRFQDLILNLGELLGLPLHLDKHGVCRLNVDNKLNIQIENDSAKNRILIACFICDVPAGKFREELLKQALKANYPFPRLGTLAYSERKNKLMFFDYLYFPNLNADKTAAFLTTFIDKANEYREAIEKGSLNII